MLLKISVKVLYYLSLILGWSCVNYDQKSNQMKLSKCSYIFNRIMMVFSMISPAANFNEDLPGVDELNKSIILLVRYQNVFQFLMILVFYKKLGAVRKSIMEALNLAINLYCELKNDFELNFNQKIFKCVVFKFLIFDTLIVFVKLFILFEIHVKHPDFPKVLLITGSLPILTTYFFNVYNIFHAATFCVFHELNKKLGEISSKIETFLVSDRLMVQEILKFEEFYFKTIHLTNIFKKVLSNFTTILFGKSLFNLLVQLVFIFVFFRLYSKMTPENYFYFFAALTVATSEFFQVFSIILCEEQVEEMV